MNERFDSGAAIQSVLFGGGKMGAAMRECDWSRTALGPVHTWPQSLRTVVRVLLDSRYAMWLAWGSELTFFCNDAYRPTLGLKQGFLGTSARNVWAEIWPDIGPRIERVLATGEATWDVGLMLFLQRKGFIEESYHSFSYSPVYDDAGKVAGMLCVVSEDTERTIGERRLATLAALSSAALLAGTAERACELAAASLADVARDLPFVLLYLLDDDARGARLVARAGLPAQASAAPERVALGGAEPAAWPFEAAAASGGVFTVEDLRARHGALVAGPYPEPVTHALVVPLARAGSSEQPAGFLVAGVSPRLALDDGYRRFVELVATQVGNAISDARALEEEKRRADSLAELDRAKTVFFSNVSHELRTPLTLMLSPIDELLAGATGAGEQARLQLAQRNGQRLLRLVNTLLDFSRIEAGRVQARYEPLDLAALTAELASVFRSALESAGVALVTDCPPLPEPVFVDRGMWEKIVLNLLSNAFKFTFEGEVRVALRADGDVVRLEVADTGTGIPEAALGRLFERFYRVEGAQGRTIEGSGIGLALVQELARLHGGKVSVTSRLGLGSRFEVCVPLGQAHLPAEQIAAASAAHGMPVDPEVYLGGLQPELRDTAWGALDEPSAPGALASEDASAPASREARATVLIADDNADMRGYLRRLLAGSHRVLAAADGLQALELVHGERPDLVLSDVMMPRLDGFGLLRALREDPATAELPLILLSARAGEEARIEGLAAGADDYLTKPFNARELLARVAGTLALARARRERALREAELRAETEHVLASIAEGFMAVDAEWRVSYANSAAERMVFKRREELLGGSLWTLFPEVIGSPFEEPYRRAMRERVPVRVDARYEPLDAWLEVNVYPVASGGLAFYFRDIKDSRLMQQALQQTDERNRFLLDLSRATLALEQPEAVMAMTARLLGEQLGCDRCIFCDVEADQDHFVIAAHYTRDTSRIGSRWRLADFGAEVLQALRGNRLFLSDDVQADARLAGHAAAYRAADIGALVCLPLHRGGVIVAGLAVHQRVPRHWRESELELLRRVALHCAEVLGRVQAQRALRVSEQAFRVLADAMPQIVHVTEPDGRVSFVNRQWNDYTGLGAEQAIDLRVLLHPDDVADVQRQWREALAAGGALATEARLKRASDGQYRWFLIRSQPERDAAGRVTRWYGTSTDIDAHKRSEEALRTSEQRFRSLADSLPHMVFAMRADGAMTWINRYASEFTGRSDDGLLGERRYELVHPDDSERVHAAWQHSLAGGAPYQAEFRFRRADGAWRWMLSRALPVRDASGSIVEWIGGTVDIDELRSAQQALQEADRRKDEFLATLAHELRNPLAPLRNAVHILQMTKEPETAGRVHAMMQRQIDHLVRLVDDLLEVSRITGGKIELRRAPVELATVLASAVETSRPLIEAGGLRLDIDIAEGPMPLDGDAVRLAQVFANLLNNAAKYTDPGGRIALIATRDNAQVRVVVRDSGIGIAAEMLPRVFDLFTQIDRARGRSQGGLGIGLSLVKSLVGMHGGSVGAASEGEGRGAEFVVRLPLLQAGTAAAAPVNGSLAKSGAAQRVLVVDDNRDAADSLGVLLEFLGASVHVVHDGEAALAAVQTHRPGLVLLDLGMPGMDGYEVARRLRARPDGQALTLVALTGWGQAKDRERTREHGFDHHLVKPAEIDALQALLDAASSASGRESR